MFTVFCTASTHTIWQVAFVREVPMEIVPKSMMCGSAISALGYACSGTSVEPPITAVIFADVFANVKLKVRSVSKVSKYEVLPKCQDSTAKVCDF